MKVKIKGMFKHLLVFSHDIAWVPAVILAAYWLRLYPDPISRTLWPGIAELVAAAIVLHAVTFWVFGCYRGIWRFASIPDLMRLMKAVVVGAIATTTVCFLIRRLESIPRSVLILYPLLLIGALSGVRIVFRAFVDRSFKLAHEGSSRALLVGAGQAGEMLVRDMQRYPQFLPLAFVDDDPSKRGQEVRGVRIRGTINNIPELLQRLAIDVVLVAMPSAPRKVLDRVVQICAENNVKCRTLPSLAELADGRIEVARLRPVTVEDLLGRDPIELNQQSVADFIQGKRVLVTGGGGSIGSELCKQVGRHEPGLLVVVDDCEYNLYRIDHELGDTFPKLIFNSVLGDVRDSKAIAALFKQFKPQVVFHAAAYKHVPLVEDNIIEGIRNNVFGTRIVANAAHETGVEAFVLISTDKTVNPTNVMGTTKRIAELYCQLLNESSNTHFITTRFGNVLASAGSVVPLFERQIAGGGPVTVTHPEITRYFMTIPEAASLILQAGSIGRGGEIFVLDMGEPVRIYDLAEKLIRLSGLQPGRDIEIVYTGLRPGEKLHEELFYAQEELQHTIHPKVMLASSHAVDAGQIISGLERLDNAIDMNDHDRALAELKLLVPEFQPTVPIEQRKHRQMAPQLQVVK